MTPLSSTRQRNTAVQGIVSPSSADGLGQPSNGFVDNHSRASPRDSRGTNGNQDRVSLAITPPTSSYPLLGQKVGGLRWMPTWKQALVRVGTAILVESIIWLVAYYCSGDKKFAFFSCLVPVVSYPAFCYLSSALIDKTKFPGQAPVYTAKALLLAIIVLGIGALPMGDIIMGEEKISFIILQWSFAVFVFDLLVFTLFTDFAITVYRLSTVALEYTLNFRIKSHGATGVELLPSHHRKKYYRLRSVTILTASLVLAIITTAKGMGDPVIVTKKIHVPNFPVAITPFRLAVISDIHLGPTKGKTEAKKLVSLVNSEKPDLIAIVGDLIDGPLRKLKPAAEELQNLESTYGTFFVTGNHEIYQGDTEVLLWIEYLATINITTLRNEHVAIPKDAGPGQSFDLIGVDDWSANTAEFKPDIAKAYDGRGQKRASVVRYSKLQPRPLSSALLSSFDTCYKKLLAHQPKQIFEASDLGVGLQISGHTHGGQFFPFQVFAWLGNPYLSGYNLHPGGTTGIYVSEGVYAWGPRARLNTRNEISLLELSP